MPDWLVDELTCVKDHETVRFELPSNVGPESLEVRGARNNRTITAKVISMFEVTKGLGKKPYNLP